MELPGNAAPSERKRVLALVAATAAGARREVVVSENPPSQGLYEVKKKAPARKTTSSDPVDAVAVIYGIAARLW